MPRKKLNKLQKRDADLKDAYQKLKIKEPNWRYSAWMEELADKFYLEPETVSKILNADEKPLYKQTDLFETNENQKKD